MNIEEVEVMKELLLRQFLEEYRLPRLVEGRFLGRKCVRWMGNGGAVGDKPHGYFDFALQFAYLASPLSIEPPEFWFTAYLGTADDYPFEGRYIDFGHLHAGRRQTYIYHGISFSLGDRRKGKPPDRLYPCHAVATVITPSPHVGPSIYIAPEFIYNKGLYWEMSRERDEEGLLVTQYGLLLYLRRIQLQLLGEETQ